MRRPSRVPTSAAPSPHSQPRRPRSRYSLARRTSDARSGRGIGLGSIPLPRHLWQDSSDSPAVSVPVPPHAAHLSASNVPRGSGRGLSGTVATASRSPGGEADQGQRPASSAVSALLAAHVDHGYSLLALGPDGGSPSGSCRGLGNKYPIQRRRSTRPVVGIGTDFVADRARPVPRNLLREAGGLVTEGRPTPRRGDHPSLDASRGTGHMRRIVPAAQDGGDDAERLPGGLGAKPPTRAAAIRFRFSASPPPKRPRAPPAPGPRRSRRHPTSALVPDPPPSRAWRRGTGIVRGQSAALPSADTTWAGSTGIPATQDGPEPALRTLQEQHRRPPHLPGRGLRPRATLLGHADFPTANLPPDFGLVKGAQRAPTRSRPQTKRPALCGAFRGTGRRDMCVVGGRSAVLDPAGRAEPR
jgi:hypothetical protein